MFLNVCNNAAQASGRRPVAIRAQRASLAEPRELSHGRLGPGRYAIVSICDRGPGIPDAAWPRLFEPFFTMKAGGTGLGLSSAWEVVQDHAGTIHVENLGPGARFSVWLPESGDGVAFAIPGDGARILLLGHPDRLQEEEDLLAEIGYEPLGVPLSSDVAELTQLLEDCDAVIIAARLPEVAIAFLNRISDAAAGRPVLAATPEGRLLGSPLPTATLSYPLRREELVALLPGVVFRRALVESD